MRKGERLVLELDTFRVISTGNSPVAPKCHYIVEVKQGKRWKRPEAIHMSADDMQALLCALDITLYACKAKPK